METQKKDFKISLIPQKPKTIEECKTIIDLLKFFGAIQISKDNMLLDNAHLKFTEHINVFIIDILSVPVEYRGQGYAKKAMECIVECANILDKPITLTIGNVTKNSFSCFSNRTDLAGYNASLPKNKIPVRKLQLFYESVGFKKTGVYKRQTMMEYTPKNK